MPRTTSLPTPNNHSASGVTFYASTTISATASLIWSTLLDFESYPQWNTFTPRTTFRTPLKVGDKGDLDAYMKPSDTKPKLTQLEITLFDEEKHQLAWKAIGFPTWFLRPERVQEVKDLGDGTCEFRSYETMAGPGRYAVLQVVGGKVLDDAMERVANNLKEEVGRRKMVAEAV